MRKIRVRAVLSLAIIMIGVIALPQLVMAYFSNAAAFFKTYPSAATVSSMKYWTDSSVSTHGFTAYFSNARSKWDAALMLRLDGAQRHRMMMLLFDFMVLMIYRLIMPV